MSSGGGRVRCELSRKGFCSFVVNVMVMCLLHFFSQRLSLCTSFKPRPLTFKQHPSETERYNFPMSSNHVFHSGLKPADFEIVGGASWASTKKHESNSAEAIEPCSYIQSSQSECRLHSALFCLVTLMSSNGRAL